RSAHVRNARDAGHCDYAELRSFVANVSRNGHPQLAAREIEGARDCRGKFAAENAMNHKSRCHFVRGLAIATIFAFLFQWTGAPVANAYVRDFTVPAAGGCPQPQHQNIAIGAVPLARQWSTSLPNINPSSIVTVAAQGTPAQLNEIEATIQQAYAIWSGVS